MGGARKGWYAMTRVRVAHRDTGELETLGAQLRVLSGFFEIAQDSKDYADELLHQRSFRGDIATQLQEAAFTIDRFLKGGAR